MAGASAQTEAEPVQRVEITGSSIKRTDAEGALPVTTVSREEIERSGAVTVADVLKRLPQSGSQSIDQRATQGGFNPGGEAIALRDLSLNATLVLLNGRRLPTYPLSSVNASFVNLDQIPASAIQRIEVLKDGASSIYGSDAVAGVINIITRKDYRGIEAALRYGEAARGDPRETVFNLGAGFGDMGQDGYNVLLSYEHLNRTRMRQIDRAYLSNSNHSARGGYDRRLPYSDPANALDLATGALLVSPACPPDSQSGGLCLTDFARYGTVVPATTRDSLYTRATAEVSPTLQLFGELIAGREKSSSLFSPDLLTGSLAVPASASGNPFGSDVLPLGVIPGAPQREEAITTDSARLLLGARGSAGEIDWEAAASHARGKSAYAFYNQLVSEPTAAALANGAVSPFGVQTNDAAAIAALLDAGRRNSESTSSELDARFTTPLLELPAGRLEMAAGTAWREEGLDDATAANVSTLINGVDYGRRDGSRRTASAYVEFVAPVLRSLELQLSGRYDRYSDFGSTTNPKLALRWNAIESLVFRASAGTGFRAPSLPQLVQGNSVAFANGIVDPQRCPATGSSLDCGGGSFNLVTGGNAALQPEESRSRSLGFVWDVGRAVELTVDRFEIDYRDQIRTFDIDTILANETTTTGALVVRGPASPQDVALGIPGPIVEIRNLPINAARTEVVGWDVELNLRWTLGDWGRFTWNNAATTIDKLREQAEPGGAFVDQAGTYQKPRTRLVSSLDWTIASWDARLAARYTGGYTDGIAAPAGDVLRIGSYTQLDAQLGWRGIANTTITLGVTNLADRRPSFSNATNSGNAPNGDLIGRAYYAALRYRFR
jgi:iron complex outermembrane recepter protein